MNKDRTLTLRIPEDLHAWLLKWAKDNDRSVNGQVLNLLRQTRATVESESHSTT